MSRQKGYSGTWTIRNDEGLTVNGKVKYIMYDLTQFTKFLEYITSDEDRRLYLLKNAGKSSNLPDFGNDIIAKAIKRILAGNVSEDLSKQQATNMVMTEEELDYLAYPENPHRGEGLGEMARALLADGDSLEKVARISGLSEFIFRA